MAKKFAIETLRTLHKGGNTIGFIVITAIVTILSGITTVKTLKSKNMLGFIFSAASLSVFGFFTVATIVSTILGKTVVPIAH